MLYVATKLFFRHTYFVLFYCYCLLSAVYLTHRLIVQFCVKKMKRLSVVAYSRCKGVAINVAEMAGTARHSTRLHSADIHGAQKTPSDTVSRLFCSLLSRAGNQ